MKAIQKASNVLLLALPASCCLASLQVLATFWGIILKSAGWVFSFLTIGFLLGLLIGCYAEELLDLSLNESWKRLCLAAAAGALFPTQFFLFRLVAYSYLFLPALGFLLGLLFFFTLFPLHLSPWGTEEHAFNSTFSATLLLLGTNALLSFVALAPATVRWGFYSTSIILSAAPLILSFILVLRARPLIPKHIVIQTTCCLAVTATYLSSLFSPTFKAGTELARNRIAVQVRHDKLKSLVLVEGRSSAENPGLPSHELFLGGELILNSETEQPLYNCFTNLPILSALLGGSTTKSTLVIGGGTGVAARNLLSLPRVKHITILESSPIVADTAKNELKVRIYNLDSLRHPKVETIVSPYLSWLRQDSPEFDLIFMERFGDGGERMIPFYISLALRHLTHDGTLTILGGLAENKDSDSIVLDQTSSAIAGALKVNNLPFEIVHEPISKQFIFIASKREKFSIKLNLKKLGLFPSKKSHPSCLYVESWKESTKKRFEKLSNALDSNAMERTVFAKSMYY